MLLQNAEKILWTKHSKEKMRYYNLSEKRVLRILRKPDRKEEGIAPKTIALMQVSGTKKHPTEIWMMCQIVKSKARAECQQGEAREKNTKCSLRLWIISAWRYPGRTLIGERPIIPKDILESLFNEDKMLK